MTTKLCVVIKLDMTKNFTGSTTKYIKCEMVIIIIIIMIIIIIA